MFQLTLVGRTLNFVKIPSSTTAASSTIPLPRNVLCAFSALSDTEYCAVTRVDLASHSSIVSNIATSCDDNIICYVTNARGGNWLNLIKWDENSIAIANIKLVKREIDGATRALLIIKFLLSCTLCVKDGKFFFFVTLRSGFDEYNFISIYYYFLRIEIETKIKNYCLCE